MPKFHFVAAGCSDEHRAINAERLARMRRNRKNPGAKGVKKQKGPAITPIRVLKAIPGSGGVISKIARRIGCHRCSLVYRLGNSSGPEWDEVRERLRIEAESIVDESETAVRHWVRQRDEAMVSATTARWVLERRGKSRGYGNPKQEVSIEGGDRPLQVQSSHIDLGSLPLPLEVRKQLLQAIEEQTQKQVPASTVPASTRNQTTRRTIRVRKKSGGGK